MSSCHTLFTQERFINAIVRSKVGALKPLSLWVDGEPDVVLRGVQKPHRGGSQTIFIAPFGLYAYPQCMQAIDRCVYQLSNQLRSVWTSSYHWTVRYDHNDLASSLRRCGIPCKASPTHVLDLRARYETLFANFSETTRNKVRRAERQGVIVRRREDQEAVSEYYNIFLDPARSRRAWTMVYDQSLFQELLKLREDVIFFSAEHSDRMIGGGWFFRDGNELLYWHGAMDYEYSRCFPLYAVINMAINLAWEERFLYFNMGSSLGSESLEQFKSFWGAKPKTCWQFEWRNPLWKALHLAWASLR